MFPGLVQPQRVTAAVMAAVAAGITLTAAGCGTASADRGPAVVVVHDDAAHSKAASISKTVTVKVGDSLKLVLASSYWNLAGSSAPQVLRQNGPTVLLPRPSSCPPIPGLGCTPTRTDFTALKAGTTVITASRTTCGEALRCVNRPTRFTLTVVVKSKSS
jgi:hypothetical protein